MKVIKSVVYKHGLFLVFWHHGQV